MSDFIPSDPKAPRFRPKVKTVLNKKVYDAFIEKYPKYKNVDIALFKSIVSTFNGNLWQGVIDNRDGVELPESLGYILIAKCNRPKKANVDFNASRKLGKKVMHRNWDSDNFLAKICYTNYSLKYRFADRELWSFKATTSFKGAVTATFPEVYNKYIHLNADIKLAQLFKNS